MGENIEGNSGGLVIGFWEGGLWVREELEECGVLEIKREWSFKEEEVVSSVGWKEIEYS